MRVVFYFEYKMVTAYYIRFECSVKDFIINIYLCYLRALNLIQAKNRGRFHAMCLQSVFSVLLLTLNLKEIYNELTNSKT